MGLVIVVQEGESFRCNKREVRVQNVRNPFSFDVCVIGEGGGFDQIIPVTQKHSVEILPDVRVCAGDKINEKTTSTKVKIVIEAPQNVRLLREELYQQELTSDKEV